MNLLTDRAIDVTQFVDSNLEPFLAYRNEPEVVKYQGWGIPYPREEGEAFLSLMKKRVAIKQDGWIQFAFE